MKVLLIEDTLGDSSPLKNYLQKWRFDLTIIKYEDILIQQFEFIKDLQVLILGTQFNNQNLLSVIHRVRQNSNYIYIIGLHNDEQSAHTLWLAGVDDCVILHAFEETLRFKINAVTRLMTSFYKNLSQVKKEEITQVIEVDLLLKRLRDEKKEEVASLKKEFINFLNLVRSLLNQVVLFGNDSLKKHQDSILQLMSVAEVVGAQQIYKDLRELAHSVSDYDQGNGTESSIFITHQQLCASVEHFIEGMNSLEQFDFFNDSKIDDTHSIFQQARILLVEDVVTNQILVKRMLEKQGSIVEVADDGKIAFEMFQKTEDPYDLIIMDMNMPVMNGFETTKAIRKYESKENNHTQIIAVTALAMRGDRELCLDVGCDEYLPKPIEREELLSICKHSLSSEKNHHIQQKKLRLGTVGLYIKNQIASYCLHSILDQYSLEYEHFLSRDDLLVSLSAQKYSLIILDIGTDIDFAYHIRTQYPKQLILMITNREQLENSSLFKYEHIIHYPFDNKDVYSELESISSVYHVQKKADEAVAFAGTISNVSDSIKIQDCIYKSDNQLAIWQKSFGSIGGDLVLSKQFNKHGRFGFILADVTGHDAKSSYVASWFSGLVQGIWAEYSEPIELLKKLNELYAHEQDEEDKRYVCALVLLWDRIRSTLYWANSGIPEGLLVSKSINHEISSEWVSWRGAPIGMFQENLFDYGQIELLEGDRLILATDGILEAVPESLFQRLGKQHRDSSAQEALNSIVDFLDRTVETFDDLTLVVFDNNPLPIASNQIRFSMPSIITEIDTTMTLIFDCLVERSNGKLDANLVIMAIREGLLNAVEHGNKGDESRLVDIDLDFHEKEVRVVISDCGAGFSLNRVKEKHADAGILRVQGRGIEMIESFSNKVEFFAGSITMHFLYSE